MSPSPLVTTPESGAPFIRGLKTQARVIGALLLRELHTRYGRENIGYLWMVGEPMILAGAVAAIHGSEHATMFGSDFPVIPFAIIGYTTFIIFRSIFGRSAAALESNMPLLYHRVITIFDIRASRALLECASMTATMALLIGLAFMLGLSDLPYRPLNLMLALVLMTWFAFAVGMATCSLTYHSPLAERLVHPISYLLMPLSGAFFVLEWIPDPYQTILSYFPMTLILEEARYGMFQVAKDNFVDIPYIISCNLFLTLCGLLALRITRRHVHLS